MKIIYPSVLLSALLSITGVQGQAAIVNPTCLDSVTAASLNVQDGTIYNLLCGAIDGTTVVTGTVRENFTTFCSALNTSLLATTRLILQSTTPSTGVTVFAPVNSAFGTIDVTALLMNPALTARIVELHISETGQILQTSDLKCNDEICAINTQVGMLGGLQGIVPKNCIQQSRTKCTAAGTSFQIGPGNRGGPNGDWPEIGKPINLFSQVIGFGANPDVLSSLLSLFSSNLNVCNGVVHVVDQVLLPAPLNSESKSGKSGKNGKGSNRSDSYFQNFSGDSKSGKMSKGGRALDQDMIYEKDEDNSSHDRRKRLLESLVEPNGNIEQLD